MGSGLQAQHLRQRINVWSCHVKEFTTVDACRGVQDSTRLNSLNLCIVVMHPFLLSIDVLEEVSATTTACIASAYRLYRGAFGSSCGPCC